MELERDDEHFEGVLGRLDSLIRRGQPGMMPPPPPPVSEATIPVLTEVYEAGLAAGGPVLSVGSDEPQREAAGVSTAEKMDRAMAAVLPVMTEVLENALVMKVQPALENALKQVLEDLHPQIEAILRQRLQVLLAQEAGNQTEI